MNINPSLISDKEKETTLNTVNSLQKQKEYSVGFESKAIPERLKILLPFNSFFFPKICQGIYVIFFPHNNTVYIGQSVNISREISMLKGGFRNQRLVNEAFQKSGDSYVAVSILQGPGLKDKETRVNLEKMIINYAGHSSINIIGKKIYTTNPFLCDPAIKRAKFHLCPVSWSQYGLKYDNMHEAKKSGCIYLFMHTKTGNFYIGESFDFYQGKVLKRHRTGVAQAQALTLQNQKVPGLDTYNRIVNDILTCGTDFFYSIIEYTGDLSKNERKQKESDYILEAQELYGNRLYNKPALGIEPNTKKRSQESKDRNRIATVAARQGRKFISRKIYPCIIKGVWYNTMVEAGRALGLTVKGTIKGRLLSPNFPEYIWLKDTKNKTLPEDPLLQEKIQKFLSNASLKKGDERKNT